MADNCNDCVERTPVVPQYSKAVPVTNENCGSCSANNGIFNPPNGGTGSQGLPVEHTGVSPIVVDDFSNSLKYSFVSKYEPIAALTVSLSLVAKISGVVEAGIVLFGKIIDEVNLSWIYNRPTEIQTQTLTNDGGVVAPTLDPLDTSYDYTGLTLGDNISFTIFGDDGKGLGTSTANATKTIIFGNYYLRGIGARMSLGSKPSSELKTLIDGLVSGSSELTTKRQKPSLIAEGIINEHFYVAIPARWGFATFWQFGAEGGMLRLADVGGVVVVASKDSLEAGEVPILINNGIAEESYYIYQSQFDNINGIDFEVK